MVIDHTENGDLDLNSENYETLKKGVVIFPENEVEAKMLLESIDDIHKFFENKVGGNV